jgi:FkbM family methyltransferase
MGTRDVIFREPTTLQSRVAATDSLRFCDEFCRESSTSKYILGRNIYAESVARQLTVHGFIDDFTNDAAYLGRPILKLGDVPKNALVLNASGGRPLTARHRLDLVGLRNLDYFAFYKLSGLPLLPMRFNEGFEEEFLANRDQYTWVHERLHDQVSKSSLEKLVNFRLDYDITHLDGFTQREDIQYFEDFLRLRADGETFIDIGAYDGFTSIEFMKRCPQFNAIHLYEPDPRNYQICVSAMQGLANVDCHPYGLSHSKATLKFDMQGSSSRISDSGPVTIEVDRLDDVLVDAPTFIKMDIEGGETSAIEGARRIIGTHHPRLAVSVYHAPGDFWRIPRQVLSIRDDYDLYMRHYTECIYESVMFFVPRT